MLSHTEWRDVALSESGGGMSQRCYFVGVSRSNDASSVSRDRMSSNGEMLLRRCLPIE